jgi:hypothetical protein
MTVLFEISLGRIVFGYSWERIASDYRLLEGGFLPIGLLFLLLSPTFAGAPLVSSFCASAGAYIFLLLLAYGMLES